MAAASVPPSPEDVSFAAQAVEFLRSWGGALFGGSGLGVVYLAGRKVQAIEGRQISHDEHRLDHDMRLKALEDARRAADVKIAELPTQARLDAAVEQLQRRMDAGFANLTQLIVGRARD